MRNIPEKLLSPYKPSETEDRIYALWEKSGFFNPDNLPERHKEPYAVVLPPPNVTGVLHIGHAYEDALQDAIVRFQRMCGKKTLWIPGTDSAAIATQTRVEKDILKKEKKTRHDLGREEMVRRVTEFAKESEHTILSQIRKMGASLDWSRYAYALDEKRSHAVTTAFKRMYEAGLIYRGHRIVNWDPKGQTTISDDEILYQEEETKFYYFTYGPFVIGTARPETKFGDKYVVMHPEDERYKKYEHGARIEVEWINGPITATIIKDEAVDPEMGSGVMTITPWHSAIDFEIAERHGLDKEQIIDRYGKLCPVAQEFAGMKITEAREKIVDKLKKKGLVEKIDEHYVHNVATSERTGAIIEPQVMEQWFVAVDKPFTIPRSEISGIKSGQSVTLKELMRKAVENEAVLMPQERFRKTYFHWIENLHDWCISRQIWFGHRIPVWYHEAKCVPIEGREKEVSACAPIVISAEEPACAHCAARYEQDPDVLDTWFSSALWTFSTLGWPHNAHHTGSKDKDDLETYHPTSFMSPAYEILQLWVSRMILMSGFHLGQVPFRAVLIHGLVRDTEGRKFSKSLGNGVDPLVLIENYGADALRMGLLIGTAIGNDINFDENKVRGYKHFANKLWNIARFVLEHTSDFATDQKPPLSKEDELLMNELHAVTKKATTEMKNYQLYLAGDTVYHYVWHTFADVVIEKSKPLLASEGNENEKKTSRQWVLLEMLISSLKLLHPFMPFVTEELWSMVPHGAGLSKKSEGFLLVETWPQAESSSF